MGYVKQSTNNPLGQRPWNAILQPGGLGAPPRSTRRRGLSAFFPNAEAIGPNSVMLDRDASNPGWKRGNNAGGSALVPRIYYPPDVLKQHTTPRGQGLGNLINASDMMGPVPARPSVFSQLWGQTSSGTTPPTPRFPWMQPPPAAPAEAGASYVVSLDASGNPVYSVPPPGMVSTGTDAQGNPIYGAPGITQATTASGAPVSVSTSLVPAGTSTASPYLASDGSIWVYGTATNSWVEAVPAGASTTSTYTDANGNVWTWNGTAWAISSASGLSSATSWLSASTVISGFPNYLIAGGAVLALFLVMKKK